VAEPVSLLAEAHRLRAPSGLVWLQDTFRRGEDASRPAPLSSPAADWAGLLHAAAFALLRRGPASLTQQLVVALPTGS
jgi:hypothetical protein